jgi:predicted permease
LGENKRHAFWEQHIEMVRALPGVVSAALINNLPLSVPTAKRFDTEGTPETSPDQARPQILVRRVTPGYFETAGVQLLTGRVFAERENRRDSERVVIINETFAKQFWPGEDPIDKRIRSQGSQDWTRVVGVVKDIKQLGFDQAPWPGLYLPCVSDAAFAMYGIVQTSGDPLSVVAAIRGAVRSVDSGLPIEHVQTMSQRVHRSVWGRRLNLWLYGIPAAAAVIMASAGIYGVISYSVSRRTREIGIRMALGARVPDVIKMVIGQGLRLILVGLGIGSIGAFALGRLLASMPNMLYSVSPTDPATFIVVPLLLTGIAVTACWIPARRATRIDPMTALRYE